MIQIRNNAALSAAVAIPASATIVPFDTTDLSTNSAAVLNDNNIEISAVGVYQTVCAVSVSNATTSPVTAVLTAYAQGKPIAGASAVLTLEGSASGEMVLPWVFKIIASQTGTAAISWYLSGAAVNLNNAYAEAHRLV